MFLKTTIALSFLLLLIHSNSFADSKEERRARKLREQRMDAALGGDVKECIALGDSLLQLWYPSKARIVYQIGAEKGDLHCIYGLAHTYTEIPSGNTIDSGIYLLERAIKAGSPEAMCELGKFCRGGIRVYENGSEKEIFPRDTTRCRALYSQAATIGYKPAQEKIDLYNLAGSNLNFVAYNAYTNGNFQLAFKLWQIGATEDHDAQAMYSLGSMCLNGDCPKCFATKEPAVEAESWYRNAGEHGYADGSYMVGELCYRTAYVQTGALDAALKWWHKAASQGHPKAAQREAAVRANMAKDQAAKEVWIAEYNATFNQRMQDNFGSNPRKATPSSNTGQYNNSPNSAQRDQAIYDKMHQEANQREKWYNDKWGR